MTPILDNIGLELLESQAQELEKQCQLHGIPMPKRLPKNATMNGDHQIFNDEYMFRQIFEGCQHFLLYMTNCIQSSVHNDSIREMCCQFFNSELGIFNRLCQYGKTKGYLEVEPIYKSY